MEGDDIIIKDSDYLKYQSEIRSMMFTAGDVRHPNAESSQMMEEIVRLELINLLRQSAHITARRNSRFMSIEDVIFCIRHDTCKVSRLLDFLSWKDLRKNVSKSSAAGDGGVATTGNQIAAEDEDILEDQEKPKLPKRRRIKLFFDPLTQYYDYLDSHHGDDNENDAEDEDIAESLITSDVLRKLKQADDLTRAMSKAEYVEYAEARQASFTYKKSKKFREWLNVQQTVDFKPNDDVIEILGYIAWEMVFKLTEAALHVRDDMKKESLMKLNYEKKTQLNHDIKKENDINGTHKCELSGDSPDLYSEKKKHLQKSLEDLRKTFPLSSYLNANAELPLFVASEYLPELDNLGNDAALSASCADDMVTATNEADSPNHRRISSLLQDNAVDQHSTIPVSPILPLHIFEACRRLQLNCPPLKQFKFAPTQSRFSTLYSTSIGL